MLVLGSDLDWENRENEKKIVQANCRDSVNRVDGS